MTPSQTERYERFLELHARPGGFVMPNAWDAVSALLLKEAGFEAIGTSSAALAASLGRIDGRHAVSRDEHLAHAVLLGDVTGLPVNGDFDDAVARVAAAAQVAAGRIVLTGRTDNHVQGLHDIDDTRGGARAGA